MMMKGNSTFSWTVPYLKEVLVSLINVIKEYGVDDAGWKSIRWEVYDKVATNNTCSWVISDDCLVERLSWRDSAYADYWHDRGLIWL